MESESLEIGSLELARPAREPYHCTTMKLPLICLVPFTFPPGIHPDTLSALRAAFGDVQPAFLDRSTPHAYGDLLRGWWAVTAPLMICEHDVVPSAALAWEMADCEHDWCTVPIPVDGHMQLGTLGLAKFSLALRQRHPLLAHRALAGPPRHGPHKCRRAGEPNPWPPDAPDTWATNVHWSVCDSALLRELTGAGETYHVHAGSVLHCHDYKERPTPSRGDEQRMLSRYRRPDR